MGRLALDVLHTLLISYELSVEEFSEEQKVKLPQGDSVALPRPPGFTILEHMLSDSSLLKKVSEDTSTQCVLVCVHVC